MTHFKSTTQGTLGQQCRETNLGRFSKKLLHIRNGCCHAIGREAGEECLAVSLPCDAGVEEDQHAAIFERTDEAAKALLEGENSRRNLVVEEGFAACLFNGLHARLDDRIAGDSEGQAVDDDATQRFALHVHSLPETRRAEEDGVGGGAELLQESFARSRAMQQDGKIQHRQEALVNDVHLGVAGEEAKGAAAGDFQHALGRSGERRGGKEWRSRWWPY